MTFHQKIKKYLCDACNAVLLTQMIHRDVADNRSTLPV